MVGVCGSSYSGPRALNPAKILEILSLVKKAGHEPLTFGFNARGYRRADDSFNFPLSMVHMKRLSALITVDSGPLHMAGVLGVPIIGLFGPTDPMYRMRHYKGVAFDSRTLVKCAHCWYNYPCKEKIPSERFGCMQIPNAWIMDELEKALNWGSCGL